MGSIICSIYSHFEQVVLKYFYFKEKNELLFRFNVSASLKLQIKIFLYLGFLLKVAFIF